MDQTTSLENYWSSATTGPGDYFEFTTVIPALLGPRPGGPPSLPWQLLAVQNIFLYIPPFLITIGLIGNVLSLVVLQIAEFRLAPTSLILSALAVVDTGFLSTNCMGLWITVLTGIDIRDLGDHGCKLLMFFAYSCRHLSSLYVALLTIERTIAVYFPMKCQQLCSKKRMAIAAGIVTLVTMGADSHFLATNSLKAVVKPDRATGELIERMQCSSTLGPLGFKIYYWVDATLVSFLPISVIFTGNILIVSKLISTHKMRKSSLQVFATNDNDKMTQTTVTLISVSTCFLIFTLPNCVFFVGTNLGAFPNSTLLENARFNLAYACVMILNYMNNSVNFFLYCFTGTKFRNALRSKFCCTSYEGSVPTKGLVKNPLVLTKSTTASTNSITSV